MKKPDHMLCSDLDENQRSCDIMEDEEYNTDVTSQYHHGMIDDITRFMGYIVYELVTKPSDHYKIVKWFYLSSFFYENLNIKEFIILPLVWVWNLQFLHLIMTFPAEFPYV